MSKRKFKKGDNVLVIEGTHKGMRGTISNIFEGRDRIQYQVIFKSFITNLYSYQMRLDAVEEGSVSDKCTVKLAGRLEQSKIKPGSHVMLSKRGLAKIHIDGMVSTYGLVSKSRSYEWVKDHNFYTIDHVDTIDGVNFYTLVGFSSNYHFTDEDLLCVKYDVGEKVRFTRETLVKLGVELSEYYGDDTINRLARYVTGPRKVLSICHKDDKVLYTLDGECFGKLFYEQEIEPAND